ncbi:unnamed protein product [Paramecium primaurelia]|uniref:EF-hand domain-containing protein n=1 Tax=Paramecium primaurelia TaxID=5886 RepID=A0A8S1LBT8_PARPR|nr:unnamed protein product [Paramecium primaurelia]
MNFYFFIQLAQNLDNFESFTTYKLLDQPRTGGLKSDNIFEFLNDNDIQITQDQLDYTFRALDEDSSNIFRALFWLKQLALKEQYYLR